MKSDKDFAITSISQREQHETMKNATALALLPIRIKILLLTPAQQGTYT
jgi:hypothetical protein